MRDWFKKLVFPALMVALLFVQLPTTVYAKTVDAISGQIEVSDTSNNVSNSGGVVTATASGWWSSKTNTVNVINSGESKALITFKYAATGDVNSFSLSPSSGTKEVTLDAGASFEMKISNTTVTLSTTTATLTLSEFTYKELGGDTSVTMTYDSALGSVTVGGAAVSTGDNVTIAEAGTALAATPKNGAEFVGWVNTANNMVLSHEKAVTMLPQKGLTGITAVFAGPNDGLMFWINDVLYEGLDNALEAVGSSGTMVLASSGTLPEGEITIPSGVTFLIPYKAGTNSVPTETRTVEGGWDSTWEYANVNFISALTHGEAAMADILLPNKGVNYKLAVSAETTLNVEGSLVIGGQIGSGHYPKNKTLGVAGGTVGDHANVELKGIINVQNGGILSACGYVLGDGNVNVASGGTLYQPVTFMDHRSGHYAAISNNDKIFPYNRYTLQNIQSDIHMVSGAIMKGYADIYTQTTSVKELGGIVAITVPERHNVTCVTFIDDSGALINLARGTLDIAYDATRYANDTAHNADGLYDRVGTTTLDFSGDVDLGKFTLKINVADSDYNLSSQTDYFPVPYNYNINLNDGEYVIANKLKLIPGSTMTVGENATLTVTANFAVMDGFRDHNVYGQSASDAIWPVFHSPETTVLQAEPFNGNGTANLIVDGTMVIDEGASFGGLIQTNGSGTVVMNGTSGLTITVGDENASKIMGIMDTSITGRSVHTLPAKLYRADKNTINMTRGSIYTGIDNATNTIPNYTYTLYTTYNTSDTVELTQTLNAKVVGSWKCAEGYHAFDNGKCPDCGANINAAIWSDSAATYYQTLGAALKAPYNSSTDYIQMLKDTNESVTIAGTVNLDLSGHTIAGVTVSGTLNGMDTANNDFSSTPGSITKLSIDGGSVSEVYQYNLGNLIGKQYIACPNGDSISFHRFDMGVKQYTFYKKGDTGALVFDLVFKGDDAAFNEIFQTGACITGDGQTQYTWRERAREYSGNIQLTKDDFSKVITVKAAVKLNEGDADSNAILGDKYFANGISLQALLDAMNNGGAG